MSAFLDSAGNQHQLPITVEMYRQAADANMTLPQFLNANYETNTERFGSVFNQVLASEGIFVRPNRELGIRATTMDEILNGKRGGMQAASVVKDAVPTSRILFPAVTLQAVEDKLVANLNMTANAFDQLVGYEESINQERYEQPVINMSKPEAGRSQGIGQLAQPASMLTLTTSDKAYRIPTWSLGLEIADQALRASSLDFVAMSLARQAAIERNERAQNYMLALLNGDVDNGESALSLDNSTTFDTAATGGAMTHKAWMKFLMKNGTKRTITHIVTDIDMAMKVEGRTGKPVITQDDSQTSRIDTQFSIMNPTWAKNPQVFLVDQASWPANTILGLDKNWAIRRVRNLSAEYNAIEAYVMRRSTAMRFDFGEHVNRMYPEAFAGYFQQ